VSTEGGAARSLATADVIDRPCWSGDGGRLVYAASGADGQLGLWIVPAEGGDPAAIPDVRGRAPAWSPQEDLIAYSTSATTGLEVRFTGSQGESRLKQRTVATGSVGVTAFSWNGRWLAQGFTPGAGDAEIVLIDVERGEKRSVLRLGPFSEVTGVAWSADDAHLVYGLVQRESRILLFDGLGRY
jgi:Tol biopolymer transport system component